MERKTSPAGSTEDTVLAIEDLCVFFSKKPFLAKETVVKAVDHVSLNVGKGEVVAIVGESGSGKTTLGKAAIGLIQPVSGRVVFFDGGGETNVSKARGGAWKKLRRSLQIVFQDPFSSLDPNMRVFDTLRIPMQAQGTRDQKEISEKASDVMRRVGLPEDLLRSYVYQLSGGQRQRVGIARVLLFNPALVVADEPVSMVDASIKEDILGIIAHESEKNQTAFMLITHEMAVARVIARRVLVMYLGKVMEVASADLVIDKPLHPYTQALLQASPRIDASMKDRITKINVKGELSLSTAHPSGCKFHPRCPYAMDVCKEKEPPLEEVQPGHFTACWLY